MVFSYAHSTTVFLPRSLHITFQNEFAVEQKGMVKQDFTNFEFDINF